MDNRQYLEALRPLELHYLAKGVGITGRETMSLANLCNALEAIDGVQDLPKKQSETYTVALLDYWDRAYQKSLDNPTHTEVFDNDTCGDWIKIQVVLQDAIFTEIEFTAGGCCLSECYAAMTLEAMRGKSISQVLEFSDADIYNLAKIKILPYRQKCITLAIDCLRALINEKTEY